jgi:membrane dipeptidase
MNDEMIKRLGENGGVIQINFGTTFLDSAVEKRKEELRKELNELLEKKGFTAKDSLAQPFIDQWKKAHFTELYADVETVADHIDHVVKIAGIDHVGLGSDFDGVGDSLPIGLKDVADYPNLIYTLLKRGYSDKDIAKICYKNVFRVWEKVVK